MNRNSLNANARDENCRLKWKIPRSSPLPTIYEDPNEVPDGETVTTVGLDGLIVKSGKPEEKSCCTSRLAVERVPSKIDLNRDEIKRQVPDSSAQFPVGDSTANVNLSFLSDGDCKDGVCRCNQNLVIARSCLNVCEHVQQDKGKEPRTNWCLLGSILLILLMVGLMLGLTVLLNYGRLVRLYHGEIEIEELSWSEKWYIWIITMLKDLRSCLIFDI